MGLFRYGVRSQKNEAYPIRTFEDFEDKAAEEMTFKDPISAILEVMGSLKQGEQLWFQIPRHSTDESWQKKVRKPSTRSSVRRRSCTSPSPITSWIPRVVAQGNVQPDYGRRT